MTEASCLKDESTAALVKSSPLLFYSGILRKTRQKTPTPLTDTFSPIALLRLFSDRGQSGRFGFRARAHSQLLSVSSARANDVLKKSFAFAHKVVAQSSPTRHGISQACNRMTLGASDGVLSCEILCSSPSCGT